MASVERAKSSVSMVETYQDAELLALMSSLVTECGKVSTSLANPTKMLEASYSVPILIPMGPLDPPFPDQIADCLRRMWTKRRDRWDIPGSARLLLLFYWPKVLLV